MLEGRVINLNDLEKKSFYSFLALYIGSSFLFILLSGFWYYEAAKNSLENSIFYKLQHFADTISGDIINAQMHGRELTLPHLEDEYEYSLIRVDEHKKFKDKYFEKNGYKVLVSKSPQEHLGIKYVVIKTTSYFKKLKELQKKISFFMLVAFIITAIISFLLSKLFMKPIHQKVTQIEQFIQDISHELNTPITALSMSTKRAVQKGVYDEKILRNISISTKQLYSIYSSLTYLNFSKKEKILVELNLKDIIKEVVDYYAELSLAKHITVKSKLEDSFIKIDEQMAKLLVSNLLSNAIKYSMPNKIITISLTKNSLFIKDEGIGIEKNKLDKIFNLYERNSTLAGGFGVGLSIVKQICDELGIAIDVKSEFGKGSKFLLSW